jgi:hypothetical protein
VVVMLNKLWGSMGVRAAEPIGGRWRGWYGASRRRCGRLRGRRGLPRRGHVVEDARDPDQEEEEHEDEVEHQQGVEHHELHSALPYPFTILSPPPFRPSHFTTLISKPTNHTLTLSGHSIDPTLPQYRNQFIRNY